MATLFFTLHRKGIKACVELLLIMVEISIKPMLEKVHHRGPDEDGLDTFGNLHLGHKRLSIIGPDSGRQPIPNVKRNCTIIACLNSSSIPTG